MSDFELAELHRFW